MSGIIGKSFFLKEAFHGLPNDNNFELVEKELPALKEGDFIVEVEYLTVDPYMRIPGMQTVGKVLPGEGVGRVITSQNNDYPVDAMVFGKTGWATHSVGDSSYRIVPSDVSHPSYFLGTLGMPGLTAYLEIERCQPKAGETFFVNSSAGAVASLTGQLAKLKGCRVVGCAGSAEKLAYLKEIGYDEVFNYKDGDFASNLKAACPNGIDCFVDHVGSDQYYAALNLMNPQGRIVVVGSISKYNSTSQQNIGADTHLQVIGKELSIRGVAAFANYNRFPEVISEISPLIEQGKVKVKEVVYEGFGKMPEAFCSLFQGTHLGKVIVKL